MAGFGDIIGQNLIKEHMQGAIASGQVSHAYIIEGERSCGKEFVAKIFAQTLLCEEGGTNPCMKCHSCIQTESWSNPDIKRLVHEKPNTITVDDIRNQISGDVMIKPYSGDYKVYIINEAEKMNEAAQNALLKTLEEPPAYVVILLLTTNAQMLLQTIRSRCIQLTMKPVENKLMRRYLMGELKIPDYIADLCIAFARGNVGRAKMLAQSEEFENIKTEAISVVKNISGMEIYELLKCVKTFSELKLSIDDFFDILMIWYRDVLLYKATRDIGDLTFKDEIKAIMKQADASTYEGLETILNAIDSAKARIAANVNFELTMELLLMTIRENS